MIVLSNLQDITEEKKISSMLNRAVITCCIVNKCKESSTVSVLPRCLENIKMSGMALLGGRALSLSQYTLVLDLLEIPLRKRGI